MRRGAIAILPLLAACSAAAHADAVQAPAAAVTSHDTGKRETAVFAGGCFWGVEAVFSHVRGVTSAVSGYSGGARSTAQYETVSGGTTGHAEAVRVTWDPRVVRYDELLRVYFSVIADPTLRDRQGPDVGTQYRSALMPLNAEQARVARAYVAQLAKSGLWSRPIATRIEPFRGFYPAESYHQDFASRNPDHGYIRRWDAPKVVALKQTYPTLYKAAFTDG
ncbi:peptide-methionine (S)-S-oxide reductase [Novosphingobium chloroacetimidivorans]|uniref:Peptide methionine sulfoxide reductase MsrA n=1 Tax=Novosphingobium chloroacetimidivorans TaxID=1428314 RepID=A0A7W7K7Y5_9SPHN|nr:peptide-methionine (S)-S-oxide reductase MsrA [Novosphingobium chloroacetimidivorans]MBB4857909.1 peptide-methionine (S)-S-oxide reductase [Novosphingobium chloroacetimidivorans]